MVRVKQFGLLVWKNFKLQFRHPWVTGFELGVPTMFALVLVIIRTQVDSKPVRNATIFPSFTVDHLPSNLTPGISFAAHFDRRMPTDMKKEDYLNENIKINFTEYENITNNKWVLAYAPDLPHVRSVMEFVESKLDVTVQAFSSEPELLDFYLNNEASVLGGVIFTEEKEGASSFSKKISYKIRLKATPRNLEKEVENSVENWKTQLTFPVFQLLGPREKDSIWGGKPGYMAEGFLSIQHAVVLAVIEFITNGNVADNLQLQMQRYPYPPYDNDLFLLALQIFFPLIMIFSFIYPALNIVKNIVIEKEKRLKESMKMMGLRTWLHWSAWYFKYLIFLLISVTIITILVTVKVSHGVCVFDKSNPFIIFLLLFVYILTTICFCFLISTLFSKVPHPLGLVVDAFTQDCIYLYRVTLLFDIGSHLLASGVCPVILISWRILIIPSPAGWLSGDMILQGAGPATKSALYSLSQNQKKYLPIGEPPVFHLLQVETQEFWYGKELEQLRFYVLSWEWIWTSQQYCNNKAYNAHCRDRVYHKTASGFTLWLSWEWSWTSQQYCNNKFCSSRSWYDFFLTFTPYFFIQPRYSEMSLRQKLASCLFSNTALAMSSMQLAMWEGTGAGAQWNNISSSSSPDDKLSLQLIFLMLVFDGILYLVLTLYIETAFPGEYGVPQPWYFPILKSYWYGTATEDHHPVPVTINNEGREFFEEEPVGLMPGIQIMSLTKVFGKKYAVNNVTINMYRSQITALLGHNGAGKSTTISMLTGLFPATCGTALVNGYDISNEIVGVHTGLGICPQHDVLFDDLTVAEHLKFFCKLKGYIPDLVKSEVDRMIKTLGLEDKRNALAKTLSGGMKRKLSVGIALVGGSQVVMLDEPTSGLDPSARRFIWDLLQAEKEHRTILLTTHFMEEADILGDRIAIMSEGEIRCCGSPLFLKKKYGAGYHVVMVKEPHCDVTATSNLIYSYVPNAELESNVGAELSFSLPNDGCPYFEKLFTELENRKTELGISSYGASITTMEEVFIKVGEYSNADIKNILKQDEDEEINMNRESINQETGEVTTMELSVDRSIGIVRFGQQFQALLTKRVIYTLRNWLLTLSQLFLPVLFVMLTLVMLKTLPKPQDLSPLVLDLSEFDGTVIPYQFGAQNGTVDNVMGEAYISQFKGTDNNVVKVNSSENIIDYLVDQGVKDIGQLNLHNMIAAVFRRTATDNKTFLTSLFNNQAFHTPGVSLAALDNAMLKYFTDNSYSLTVTNHPMPRTVSEQSLFTGIICLVAVSILEIPQLELADVAKALDWTFSVFLTNYCLGRSVSNLYQNSQFNKICNRELIQIACKFVPQDNPGFDIVKPCCKGKCGDVCLPWETNFLAWTVPGIGRHLTFLVLQSIMFWICVYAAEINLFRSLRYAVQCKNKYFVTINEEEAVSAVDDDDDVIKEKDHINLTSISSLFQSNILILQGLTKYYKRLLAVDHLSLGVRRGECFGLLGINGAGKTTTFKMLTGDEAISSGDAYIDNLSIKKHVRQVQQLIGYCPQFDALIEQMTGKEVLTMFAHLRGMPRESISKHITHLSSMLYFNMHIDKRVKDYSGGNRRKLSAAVALVGDPPIIFLDEPTTGMDPVARRCLWDALEKNIARGRSIILTSHSMEECEALCNRLAIMVNGKFCCLGSPQHLKNKFGQGYTLIAKVGCHRFKRDPILPSEVQSEGSHVNPLYRPDAEHQRQQKTETNFHQNLEDVKSFIENTFQGCILKRAHQGFLHYHIPDTQLTWAEIFGIMENAKVHYNIVDYSIGQTTLEQVFLNFVRAQRFMAK
ncbi:ATP-binding cassette sub-family A member 3-like [Limulus polyphemus]|uniref:ATP-binding cassette sub-family A member 3-like n=1 Tax=Limulus polyphemus TaxID=6850 RepID=A0ABM1TC50_LIMPO|nr:ATP-binding cassette sub-family A member 3-like [Limulus polyphemus]